MSRKSSYARGSDGKYKKQKRTGATIRPSITLSHRAMMLLNMYRKNHEVSMGQAISKIITEYFRKE